MMINNQIPPQQNEDKESFATNWYGRINEIFQLVVSDYIWQQYGDFDKQVSIQRIVRSDTHGILYDQQADEVVATFIFNPKNAEWTIYAKEEYPGGSETAPSDTF